MKHNHVLVIDDEDEFREALSNIIRLEGFTVFQAKNVREGLKILDSKPVSVVVTDVKMPDGNGLYLLEKIKEEHPFIEVIVVTAYGTIKDGVNAMKQGAFDYITKGEDDDKIHVLVERAAEKAQLHAKLHYFEDRIGEKYGFENIIGESAAIKQAIEMAQKVAPTDMSVLLQGETGTGKELFAQAIHQSGPRKGKPFVALNCSAFPKEMLESELFGFKKGAFTSAVDSKQGLVEKADSGTLFLDEIGEMDGALQAKLLRFLEEKTFTKLGETEERQVDIRIIAATNKDLKSEAKNKNFREDLYYRLAGFEIDIPPLRERAEDIQLLAKFFLKRLNEKTQEIDKETMQLLKKYPWKGNIRELKNTIERGVILAENKTFTTDLLPPDFHEDVSSFTDLSPSTTLKDMEQYHIKQVLELTEGNKTKAAKILGIGTTTLYRKIEEYDL